MCKRAFKSLICACMLVVAWSVLAAAVPNPQSGKEISREDWVPTIDVVEINDHILAFYDGRDISSDPPLADNYVNWVYWGAMDLGVCTYAIYQGDTALVYDTMPTMEQAAWIRKYLENKGIQKFIVVLSHWHKDHIAGNEVYEDSDIIAVRKTRQTMFEVKDKLEDGTQAGPPAINPVILPNILFDDRLDVYVGDILVELHHFDIHSPDGDLIYLPADKILFSGDTLEDTVTYVTNPEDFPTHIAEMKRLRSMDFESIYPNHGSLDKIKNGGYDKTFIDSTINYISKLVKHSKDKDFLKANADLKTFIKDDLDKSWVIYFPAYDEVHANNLQKVHDYYKDKPLPKL